jgi:hypothetical protein
MKNERTLTVILLVMMLAFGIVLTGCESLVDILTPVGNAIANDNSSKSETGQVYTLYNNSSHDVLVWDNTGSATIRSGSSAQFRFGKNATVYSVNYSPDDLVSVSQSGYSFTFRDK